MSEKAWHVLGGVGIAGFVALLIFFIQSPAVREIGGLWIGGIGLLVAWFGYSVYWIHNLSSYRAVNAVSTVGFGAWVAFVTALTLRPDFAATVVPVATWVGAVAVLAIIMYGSIKAIRK